MSRMTSEVREKTIISLQMVEIIESINRAMKVRRAMIGIDYSNNITPKLTIKMPNTEREVWAELNTRTRTCYPKKLVNRDLLALESDLVERVNKFEGGIILVAAKVPNRKLQARLQIRFAGMTQIALTLMHCDRGYAKEQDYFLIPKALE